MATAYAHTSSTMKTICRGVTDKVGNPILDKTSGKPVTKCKTIKVRKKLDGKKVPNKK